MHPVRILIVRYMFVCCPSLIRRHLACLTEAVRYIFVTGTFQPFYVRCMYVCSFGFSTGLTFLPPDNKNSYPFHVRRFNPVKCDRDFSFKYIFDTRQQITLDDLLLMFYNCLIFQKGKNNDFLDQSYDD